MTFLLVKMCKPLRVRRPNYHHHQHHHHRHLHHRSHHKPPAFFSPFNTNPDILFLFILTPSAQSFPPVLGTKRRAIQISVNIGTSQGFPSPFRHLRIKTS